jgi:hypothetical protein
MQGIKNLLSDTHGILGFALIAAATVLCALGIMPLDKWENYSEAIFFGVAGAHAAISVGESLSGRGNTEAMLDHPTIQEFMQAIASSYGKPSQPSSSSVPPPTQAPTPEPPKAA